MYVSMCGYMHGCMYTHTHTHTHTHTYIYYHVYMYVHNVFSALIHNFLMIFLALNMQVQLLVMRWQFQIQLRHRLVSAQAIHSFNPLTRLEVVVAKRSQRGSQEGHEVGQSFVIVLSDNHSYPLRLWHGSF